jgi:hypothetical protein
MVHQQLDNSLVTPSNRIIHHSISMHSPRTRIRTLVQQQRHNRRTANVNSAAQWQVTGLTSCAGIGVMNQENRDN